MLFSRSSPIELGQRFLRLVEGVPAVRPGVSKPEIWEVVEVRPDPSGIDHAVLVDVDQKNRFKTLSLYVLKDRSRYIPVEAGPAAHGRQREPLRLVPS